MINHIKTIHVKPFKCGECDFTDSSKENVLKHIQNTHSTVPLPQPKKQFKCSECDYSNIINDYVIKHMKTAHPKQYKCAECEFMSADEETVIKHLKEVHAEKNAENNVFASELQGMTYIYKYQVNFKLCPMTTEFLVHVFHYSIIISTKNQVFISIIWEWDLNLGRKVFEI